MREWIYSPDGTAQVTVSEIELIDLISSGQIDPNVLIWSEGLPDWIAVKDSQFSNSVGDTAICAVTGKTMLKSKMLQYGDDWVDPDEKDNFVSGLMEGKKLCSTDIKGPWPYQSLVTPAAWAKGFIIATTAVSFLYSISEVFISSSMTSSDTGDPGTIVADSFILGIATLASILVMIPAVVFYCVWVNRLSKNCHAVAGRSLRDTPGMMVAYYFIPFANLWMPLPHMKEMWSLTLDYRRDTVTSHSPVHWWWGTWIGAGIIAGFISGFLVIVMPNNLPANLAAAVLTSLVQVVSAYLVIQIITKLTERHVEIFEE